ncbi:hypothetical protein Acid345_4359 [Candidatus Koribacter versatilis Ellin345]|uniref:Uncharacterized protein n=1 Tax=Koribacter versatilis (strain Ellin345) TaxID=204669 RepID=Q1IIE1_KORVE|nr:hypothetical protein [Candidatus Koribacter versatilis]ABF43359.1 hypothetical protein Acid345_4359 [Candidatus Koribacter versatilis Ellin345]
MSYLDASEYSQYGLDPAVPDVWVEMASTMIDAHCKRPSLEQTQYVERVRVLPGARTVRLSYLPLAQVVSTRGRFSQARRGEMADVAAVFGIPGTWTAMDTSSLDTFAETGEVNVISTMLGFTFDELEITYTAGWAQVPDAVKHACAQIVRNAVATPALNVKTSKIDTMRVDYFRDSLLDESVRELLAPYVAQKVG